MADRKLVKNFYRTLYVTAFVAGATLVGGPIAGAEATAALATPLGIATVELAADQATDATLDVTSSPKETKTKKKRTTKQKTQDKKRSAAWAKANEKGRKQNGDYKKGWSQKRIALMANKILKKL